MVATTRTQPTPLEDAWREFARNAIPPVAGAAQRFDMRRSFFAGAAVAYGAIAQAAITESEDKAKASGCLAMLDALRAELIAFNPWNEDGIES